MTKRTVAIIGGGIIGGSIAWRLTQRGARVTVFEAGRWGGEASWAGAGMLAPGGEVVTDEGWGGMAIESARVYPDFVRELTAESGVAIDYRACGGLELARSGAEIHALTTRSEAQASIGIRSEAAAATDIARIAPAVVGFDAGRFYPADAIVDPRDVMAALRRVCPDIREGRRVREVSPDGDGVRVDGALFDAAVIAAGAWSSELVGVPELPTTFPVRGHLLGYQRAAVALGPIVRRGHTYLLQRSSGFLIAGTSEERVGFDRTIDQATAAGIAQRAAGIVPALAEGPPTLIWTGFRPATQSLEPEVRRVGEHSIWLACGHYRNGILLAPATAARVAGAVV